MVLCSRYGTRFLKSAKGDGRVAGHRGILDSPGKLVSREPDWKSRLRILGGAPAQAANLQSVLKGSLEDPEVFFIVMLRGCLVNPEDPTINSNPRFVGPSSVRVLGVVAGSPVDVPS
ncbi:hypothetical protein CRG98_035805 [Punica granatum]|uniref:Uncharacterized protein n=1 Tax=Punica granatum TaxID=22663 RepID=A0A2I0IIJ3_PUNGR|nr:hypothetical protein CRG98_035805 [Punica granatum]